MPIPIQFGNVHPLPAFPAFTPEKTEGIVFGIILIIVGFFLANLLSKLLIKAIGTHLTQHQKLLWKRAVSYSVIILFTLSGLHEMGLNLSIFLGAAGLFTVALGFASQTSASNLISGLFIIGEGSFAVDDIIVVDKIEGRVLSIDFMSIKLLTRDNTYIRLPNEMLIKTPVKNLTRFNIRRIPLTVSVAYREDITNVREILMALANKHPLILDEPKPFLVIDTFAASSIDLFFGVWVLKENYFHVRDEIQEMIKTTFDESNISIPFPQVQVHTSTPESIEVGGAIYKGNRDAAPF